MTKKRKYVNCMQSLIVLHYNFTQQLQEGEQAVRETKEENQQLQQLLNLSQEAIRAANRRADTAQQKIREKEEEV